MLLHFIEPFLIGRMQDEVGQNRRGVNGTKDQTPFLVFGGSADLKHKVMQHHEVLAEGPATVHKVNAAGAIDSNEIEPTATHERKNPGKGGILTLDFGLVPQ